MRVIFTSLFLAISVTFAGCGGGTNTNANNSGNVNNSNAPKANSTNPLATTTPTPEPTTNNAPTLSPIYKSYCEAMTRKDETAVRKLYSAEAIKEIEAKMKALKVKTLVAYLEDDFTPGRCEVRNEQITGDSAIAEVRTESYPNGVKTIFVRENGEWKLTGRSPVLDIAKPNSTK